jgi:hypothetical protein
MASDISQDGNQYDARVSDASGLHLYHLQDSIGSYYHKFIDTGAVRQNLLQLDAARVMSKLVIAKIKALDTSDQDRLHVGKSNIISRTNCMFFPTCSTFPTVSTIFLQRQLFTVSTISLQCPLFPDMLHFLPTKRSHIYLHSPNVSIFSTLKNVSFPSLGAHPALRLSSFPIHQPCCLPADPAGPPVRP